MLVETLNHKLILHVDSLDLEVLSIIHKVRCLFIHVCETTCDTSKYFCCVIMSDARDFIQL